MGDSYILKTYSVFCRTSSQLTWFLFRTYSIVLQNWLDFFQNWLDYFTEPTWFFSRTEWVFLLNWVFFFSVNQVFFFVVALLNKVHAHSWPYFPVKGHMVLPMWGYWECRAWNYSSQLSGQNVWSNPKMFRHFEDMVRHYYNLCKFCTISLQMIKLWSILWSLKHPEGYLCS